MNITNYKVYDLEESIVASGLPMMAEYDENGFGETINALKVDRLAGKIRQNPHFKRACTLAANPAGSGHNNFLSGIVVSMNVTATNVWWMQLERYHFVQIVSSQSKMHKLHQMLNKDNIMDAPLNDHVYITSRLAITTLASDDDVSTETLVYNCPMGLELTARITTNYLQLKTIFSQRHNHKLTEWKDFCRFIETLPYAKELIIENDIKEHRL